MAKSKKDTPDDQELAKKKEFRIKGIQIWINYYEAEKKHAEERIKLFKMQIKEIEAGNLN